MKIIINLGIEFYALLCMLIIIKQMEVMNKVFYVAFPHFSQPTPFHHFPLQNKLGLRARKIIECS